MVANSLRECSEPQLLSRGAGQLLVFGGDLPGLSTASCELRRETAEQLRRERSLATGMGVLSVQ